MLFFQRKCYVVRLVLSVFSFIAKKSILCLYLLLKFLNPPLICLFG